MVAGTTRMSLATVKRQPINQRKRKCTRADPTQTRILLKNYDAEARPNAEQFADMSQKTNLPVEWIKKWFLRKRKADGKNRTLVPTEPIIVENEPPTDGGRALRHVHSKFWSMDAFAAADSTSFSPSVGHIPKYYGHQKRSLRSGNTDDNATESQGNGEEKTALSSRTLAEAGCSYVAPSDSVLTGENAEITTPANYDLQEMLLGADASGGYVSPSANEDVSRPPAFERHNVTITVDELLSVVSSPERSVYPGNPFDEGLSHSESVADLEFGMANYPVALMLLPTDTIDDLVSASGDLNFTASTSCSTSDDLEFSAFDSADGFLDSDLGSLPGFANLPSYMTSILGEPSASYESLLFQGKQAPTGDSVDVNNCGDLLSPAATRQEPENASALGLSLLNFYDDVCGPTVSMTDFEGFDIKGETEVVGSDGEWWVDGFDTVFGLREEL